MGHFPTSRKSDVSYMKLLKLFNWFNNAKIEFQYAHTKFNAQPFLLLYSDVGLPMKIKQKSPEKIFNYRKKTIKKMIKKNFCL